MLICYGSYALNWRRLMTNPSLPAHIEEMFCINTNGFGGTESKNRADAKLRAILEAAQAVVEEYSHPFGGLVLHPELTAALDKLKEAMSDAFPLR